MYKSVCELCRQPDYSFAIIFDHAQCVRMLHLVIDEPFGICHLDLYCSKKVENLDMFRYMLVNQHRDNIYCLPEIPKHFITQGKFESLKLFYDICSNHCEHLIHALIESNQLQLIQWFVSQGWECTVENIVQSIVEQKWSISSFIYEHLQIKMKSNSKLQEKICVLLNHIHKIKPNDSYEYLDHMVWRNLFFSLDEKHALSKYVHLYSYVQETKQQIQICTNMCSELIPIVEDIKQFVLYTYF